MSRGIERTGDAGPGRLSRLLRRLGRRLPDRRPLQIDEVVAATVDGVRTQALAGIRARYLPSGVRIAVSGEDRRYLAAFEAELAREIRRSLGELIDVPGSDRWVAVTEAAGVELVKDPVLEPGAPPRIGLRYPDGVRQASWSAGAAARERLGPAGGPDRPLSIVLTTSSGDGTALQEALTVWLGLELPRALVEPSAAPGETLRVRHGAVVDATGAPVVVDGRPLAALPPPAPRRTACLPITWDGPWARLHGAAGPLIWCPGGVLLLGRDPAAAHLVPTGAPPSVSAAHLALWRHSGALMVADLASTNGTRAGDRPLVPSQPAPASLPATLVLGQGSMVVEVRSE